MNIRRSVGDEVVFLHPTLDLNTGEWGDFEIRATIVEVSKGATPSYRLRLPDGEETIIWFSEASIKDVP